MLKERAENSLGQAVELVEYPGRIEVVVIFKGGTTATHDFLTEQWEAALSTYRLLAATVESFDIRH